jgi:hypothetical protein
MGGMRAADLLRSIDSLPYGERVRAIADQALRLRGTPALDELLTDLSTGPADHRVIGLRIAQITGDVAYVTRLLHDREPTVQAQALAAVGRWSRRASSAGAGDPSAAAVSDDELRILHDDAPAALRPRLLHAVPAATRSGWRRSAGSVPTSIWSGSAGSRRSASGSGRDEEWRYCRTSPYGVIWKRAAWAQSTRPHHHCSYGSSGATARTTRAAAKPAVRPVPGLRY